MPVLNRIAAYAEEMKGWRRHLHQHPELGFDCHDTAAFVAARLREFGVDEIHTGIAKTGIVAIINGQGPGDTIGLRADTALAQHAGLVCERGIVVSNTLQTSAKHVYALGDCAQYASAHAVENSAYTPHSPFAVSVMRGVSLASFTGPAASALNS